MPLKSRDMIDMSDPRVAQIGHPAPPWMVNYADLMTELVCFFVILYALSAALNKDVQEAKKDVEEKMKQVKVSGEVTVDKEGMKITIQEQGENVFFESGSAELSPRMKEIMAKIGPALLKLAKEKHDIVVEGHTDDVPIRARFASNWELSTARATSVVQHMIQGQAFPPERMGAIGYGQFRPLVPNTSAENRAKNRRVVFFVKNAPTEFKDDKKGKAKKAEGEAAVTEESAPGEQADATGPPAEQSADEAAGSNPIPEANNTPPASE